MKKLINLCIVLILISIGGLSVYFTKIALNDTHNIQFKKIGDGIYSYVFVLSEFKYETGFFSPFFRVSIKKNNNSTELPLLSLNNKKEKYSPTRDDLNNWHWYGIGKLVSDENQIYLYTKDDDESIVLATIKLSVTGKTTIIFNYYFLFILIFIIFIIVNKKKLRKRLKNFQFRC